MVQKIPTMVLYAINSIAQIFGNKTDMLRMHVAGVPNVLCPDSEWLLFV
jgi:hypothetical protein